MPSLFDRKASLLYLVLAADAFIIALHIVHTVSTSVPDPSATPGRFFTDPFFSLEQTRGFGEGFQYVKFFWLGAALLALAHRHRETVMASWAGLFAFLLADDLFEVHETLGERVTELLDLPGVLGLRPVDLGELVVVAVVGVSFVSLIAIGHWRSGGPARKLSTSLGVLLVVLAFFGVAVDMVHSIVNGILPGGALNDALVVLEDGGEMIVTTFMVAAVAWGRSGLDSPPLGPDGVPRRRSGDLNGPAARIPTTPRSVAVQLAFRGVLKRSVPSAPAGARTESLAVSPFTSTVFEYPPRSTTVRRLCPSGGPNCQG